MTDLFRSRRRLGPFEASAWLVAAALAVLCVAPIVRVVVRLIWVDGAIDLSPIRDTLALEGLLRLLLETLALVVASSSIALLLGSLLAWANERTDARLGLMTDALPLLPFLLPPVAGAIGWVLLMSPRAGYLNVWIRDVGSWFGIEADTGPFNIFGWYGLIFVFVIYQIPFAFLLVSAGLRNMDTDLEEQARICGAGILHTLRTVTLPALRPSLGGAVLLMAWQGFAIFSLPAIIGGPAGIETVSVRMVRVLSFTFPPDTGVAVGLSMILMGFVGITWYLQSRALRSNRFAGVGGKGQNVVRRRLGVWKWPVRAMMLSYVGLAALLPLMALLIVCLNGFWSRTIRWSELGLGPLRESVFDNPSTKRALVNSLQLGFVGASIGMLAAALIAVVVVRSPSSLGRLLDAAIKMPASISNIVLSVGILLIFAGQPFGLSGSVSILLIGYLVLYLPQGSVAADTAASQVSSELTEASRIAGAGAGKTFRRIQLPLMLPGLMAGWALLFARMCGDLTASAILSGTRNPVVGFRILEEFTNGSYADVAALATVLVAITATVIVTLLVWARRRSRWGTTQTSQALPGGAT